MERYDAGWCAVQEALETAVLFLGEERVVEIVESGDEDRISELAIVFMDMNLRRPQFSETFQSVRPSCPHWLLVHLSAEEFFLAERGWYENLSPDA